MLPNPLLRKLVQISEEALPLIHGNDFFIVTQRDVRQTEESCFFTMSKILPNGGLKMSNALGTSDCLQQFFQPKDFQWQQVLNCLLEFLNYHRNNSQECQQHTSQEQYFAFNNESFFQPMEVVHPADTVASMYQQLQWNKYTNTSAPFPLHYSRGTSTTEIDYKFDVEDRIRTACENCIRCTDKDTNVQQIKNVCNKKSTEVLDAREQLKNNKIKNFNPT